MTTRRSRVSRPRLALALLALAALALGSWRDPQFWRSDDARGDRLLAREDYAAAASTYRDPWRIGVAQYRNGDFKAAVKTFARVPGAEGAFNQGNASLLLGDYDAAVQRYDRALGFRPGWDAAEDNKALALARRQALADAGKDRDQASTDTLKPDDIVFDQKGSDDQGKPVEINSGELSDEELRATWLRRVQTSPGDFLRAKFAYQAAQATAGASHLGQSQP
ncbi:MAG: hypothetical protein ACK5HY_06150 [Parahaliea sp.]